MSEAQPIEDAPVVEAVEETTVNADAEAEVTEAVESEEVTQDAEPTDSSPEQPKDRAKERIEDLNKKWREQQRENEYLRAQLEQKQPVEIQETDGKTLADFDYDEVAYQKHVRETVQAQAQQNFERETQQQAAIRKQADFRMNENTFAANYDDYNTVTRNPSVPINEGMVEVLQGMPEGPAVLYHLGKNVEVAAELSRLPFRDMAVRVGEIKASLNAIKAPKISTTPEPTPKIKAVVNKVEKDPLKMSDAEFAKMRRKQIANR